MLFIFKLKIALLHGDKSVIFFVFILLEVCNISGNGGLTCFVNLGKFSHSIKMTTQQEPNHMCVDLYVPLGLMCCPSPSQYSLDVLFFPFIQSKYFVTSLWIL